MTSATLLCMLLAGCSSPSAESGDMRVIAEPRPKPPPPPPDLVPVVGTFTVETVNVDAGDVLGFAGHAPTDGGTVQAIAQQVATMLDQHLDAVQRGAPTLPVLGADWVGEAVAGTQAALTTDLAVRENPITAATYAMTLHVEQAPTLLTVALSVVRIDGTTASIDMIFDVAGEQPALQVVSGRTP